MRVEEERSEGGFEAVGKGVSAGGIFHYRS